MQLNTIYSNLVILPSLVIQSVVLKPAASAGIFFEMQTPCPLPDLQNQKLHSNDSRKHCKLGPIALEHTLHLSFDFILGRET